MTITIIINNISNRFVVIEGGSILILLNFYVASLTKK